MTVDLQNKCLGEMLRDGQEDRPAVEPKRLRERSNRQDFTGPLFINPPTESEREEDNHVGFSVHGGSIY